MEILNFQTFLSNIHLNFLLNIIYILFEFRVSV
jgi:hypothetical protein